MTVSPPSAVGTSASPQYGGKIRGGALDGSARVYTRELDEEGTRDRRARQRRIGE